MVCIYCGANTQIINSRPKPRFNQTWRRRHCKSCLATYTTIEQPSFSSTWLVSKTGSLESEPFYPEKLFLSLYRSLEHRVNPLTDAKHLCATVIVKLEAETTNGLFESSKIRDISLVCLRRFDKTAAVHYEAFHND
jgi:transcriptional regulator NrdR family protein